MKYKNVLRNIFSIKRKYLNQIYLRITFILLLVITTLSGVLYFYIQNMVRENTYETNKQVLVQMEYNIRNMDDIIKKITLSTFTDANVSSIMNGQNITEANYYDISQKIGLLQKNTLNFNPFIHSIYIYNNYDKRYFGTYMGMFTPDKTLSNTLLNYTQVPKIMPIWRKFDTGEYGNKLEDIFTYVMYESVDSLQKFNGAVFVNVKAQWVIDNIKTIGLASPNKADQFYIITDRSEVLFDSNEDENMTDYLQGILKLTLQPLIDKGRTSDFITIKMNGKKYFITFLQIKQANWIVLKVQPYNEVFNKVDKIRNIIISIGIIFVVFAFYLSLNISRRIYKPVDGLMQEIRDNLNRNMSEENTTDEIQFLKGILKKSLETMDSSMTNQNKNADILNAYYIKKLLTDSISMSKEDLLQEMNQEKLSIDLNKGLVVCVIKIDDYKKFNDIYSAPDRKLYKFAILNIAGEVVSRVYPNETIDMQNDHLVMLINIGDAYNVSGVQIKEMFIEIQQHVQSYFDISISIALSDTTEHATEISGKYNLALNYSMYRYIFGRTAIITKDIVKINIDNNLIGYSNILEQKLIEAIKSGKIAYTEEIIARIIKEISQLKFNNILLSLMSLINTVKMALSEANRNRSQHPDFDLTILNNNFFEFEYLEDFSTQLFKLLKDGMEVERVAVEEKHIILIDTMKEIVIANYADPNFCAAKVADMLKLSLTHLSRVFKNNMKVSLADHINEVRIGKAAELLKKTDLSVNQIISRVGIDNESNFYRNFKKRYDATPKDYALNSRILLSEKSID